MSVINSANNKRTGILSAGNLLVDHVLLIPEYPAEGTLITMQKVSQCVGGAPLNVLISLAKMGVQFPLSAAGMIGDDANGAFILSALRDHKIEAQFVQQDAKSVTSHTFVMTAKNNGQRTFFHELGANSALNIEFFNDIKTNHKIFHLGYLLLLAGLDAPDDFKNSQYQTKSARLLAEMQEKGYLVSLDLVSVNEPKKFETLVKPCLPQVNYLIINELEAEMLSGIAIRKNNKIDHEAAFSALANLIKTGVKNCAAIHCPEGGFAMDEKGATFYAPSFPLKTSEIKGTVGAGDAFCAGFLYALHENWTLEKALPFANACAWFNLHAANSVDGTKTLQTIVDFIIARENTVNLS